jgi:hypothetical protein
VSFVSITVTESFFVVLRTNLSTHIYKSVRVKTDILIFASAIEGALDLERSHVLVPCSAIAYFSLARRRRRARSLAALTGTTDPREKGDGNKSFLPNVVFLVSSCIISREDVVYQ